MAISPAQLEHLQKHPEDFIENVMGVSTLEPYQRAALRTIAQNKRVAISACHDVGKSFLLGRVVPWFASCFPYSKIITTAPTFNQVKNILWSEIRSAHARSKYPLGGRLNLTDWHLSQDGDWFALGFTPRNELNSDGGGQGTQSTFQGFHAPHVLVVFDEATGVPHNIWTMAEGLMTSANVKWVCIGNPTSRNSQFYKCFTNRAWTKVHLSCFDSPNFSANGITNKTQLMAEVDLCRGLNDDSLQKRLDSYKVVQPHLLVLDWAVERILDWGVDHPLTVSKILGEFPKAGDNTLIGLDQVEESFNRLYHPTESDLKCLGVDVARFGTDSTVLTGLHGARQFHHEKLVKRDTMQVAGRAIVLIREHAYNVVVVDETGLGAGVVDALNEAQREGRIPKHVKVIGVQFGARPFEKSDKDMTSRERDEAAKYANLKARLFGLLQEAMRTDMQLTTEDAYLEELPTIMYSFDSKGRMVIESKDDYKKRTGRGSPDSADSLALANFGRHGDLGHGRMLAKVFADDFVPPFAAGLNTDRGW